MKLLFKLIAIASVLCCTGPLQAQQADYHFRHLDFSNGLSHNQVTAIYKDSRGFMWFGTLSGLNRYDGYMIKTFHHSIKDSTSLSDDYIAKIVAGPFKKLWIQLRTGFNIYDPVTEKFDRRADKLLQQMGLPGAAGLTDMVQAGAGYWFVFRDSGLFYYEYNKPVVSLLRNRSLPPFAIAEVKTDSKNNLWIVYANALIEKIDAASKKVIGRTTLLQQKLTGENKFYHLFIDSQDECWIYADGVFNGAYRVNMTTNTIEHIAKDEGKAILSSNIIAGIAEDNKGLLWIATDHGGLNVLDKKNMQVRVVLNKEGDDKSLTQNSLTEIYKDDLGIMWVGTYKQGINYYQEGINKFPLYTHKESDATSLPFNDVNRFAEDAKGNIWIGTNGGGLIYFDRTRNTFKQFRHNAANDNSLCNDVIVSLWVDHKNILWIGTYYGGLDSYDGNNFKHYHHNNKDTNSLADDRVYEIYEDKNNDLWIGTYEAGLEKFDRLNKKFIHYKPGAPNSVHTGFISSIIEDRQGNLWVGTSYGIEVKFKGSQSFQLLLPTNTGLSNDNVNTVFQDSRGAIWAATREGLNIYDAAKNSFQVFRKEDGLPDNTILDIAEDNAGFLWLSTPNGLTRMTYKHPGKRYVINCLNYDRIDGLQEKQFNQNAMLKTSSGELIFGGAKGFNLFDPAQLKINVQAPAVVLTGLQVFNQDIAAGSTIGNQVVLKKSIAETDEIRLKYDQNIFSLEFAALSYINTRKNKYAYRLQGFNNNWLYSDGSLRKVTYTNLDPGKYTFYVKASNEDGVWNEKGIAVNIVILPPFWKTQLAYFLYALFVICILIVARRMVIRRARTRFALEQERKEAQRMHEVDMMKIRFFTNMSHEFRTPLSLIITPLETIIRSATEPSLQPQYQMIHRNARRLLNLVNQLLDFRKMEVHELKLHPAEGDIVHFIRETCYSFTDIAEKKQIRFSYNGPSESLVTRFDHDKLERILFNLLSNAFKFTAANGEVAVDATIEKNTIEALLQIKIKDTGIGIPADRQEKIFERFFQHDVPGTMINQGSGIGLAITKEFVHLFNGTIHVESTEFKGSCFTVLLPLRELKAPADTASDNVVTGMEAEAKVAETINTPGQPGQRRKKFTILLVEDSEDFLFYLKDNLLEYYNIITAVNGKEGWQKTLSGHPDIVVSDIIMPGITGIELCHKIKNDRRTEHIPVVLLTALTGDEQQLRSIETGASDYLTKPFNFELLLSKIKNLLLQQQALRETFTKKVEVQHAEMDIENERTKFVQNVVTIIEKNISDPDFSVEDLSRALHMSRSAVYRKLFVITGKTPIEYIRTVRLERAAQLLRKTNKTVAEVAYETGFNNPKYFSRNFKTQFGVVPSAYQDTANEGNKNDSENE